MFTIIGYALDTAATPNQPTQGSGIDHVSVYFDKEKDDGGTFIGDADLAFTDTEAAGKYGAQFGASGWRVDFKPTALHSGAHNLFVYAHSVVTGKEGLGLTSFNIVEHLIRPLWRSPSPSGEPTEFLEGTSRSQLW